MYNIQIPYGTLVYRHKKEIRISILNASPKSMFFRVFSLSTERVRKISAATFYFVVNKSICSKKLGYETEMASVSSIDMLPSAINEAIANIMPIL